MFEPKASFYLFEQLCCEDGDPKDRPRANWSKPATLSEIKQIKLLEQACEKASKPEWRAYLLNHTRHI